MKFTGNIISECEKTEETLMTSWYPAVTAVFNDKNINKGLKVSLSKKDIALLLSNMISGG